MLSAAGVWASFPLADPIIGLHNLLAEARVAVKSDTSLIEAHRLGHEVEHALVHGVRRLTSATIHVEPLPDDAVAAHDLVAHHH